MGSINLYHNIHSDHFVFTDYFLKKVLVSGLFWAAGRLMIIGSQMGPSSITYRFFFTGDLDAEFP